MIDGNELIWEIFKKEVLEAAGCTETSSVGFACAMAIHIVESRTGKKAEVSEIVITLDPATKKNGSGVGIAGTDEKGFHIAAALGAICGKHEEGLLALKDIDSLSLKKAKEMEKDQIVKVRENKKWKSFRVEVRLYTDIGKVLLVIEESHTNVTRVEIDNEPVTDPAIGRENVFLDEQKLSYRDILVEKEIRDLVELARCSDPAILEYIKKGVEVNLLLSREGLVYSKTAQSLLKMVELGICSCDPMMRTKIKIASAVEARMRGIKYPAMSSGGSGNQGNIAILVPYFMGKYMGIEENVIYRSIVLSHLVNAYVKCHTGSLSSMCGCSIAAGLGAAAALVFQQDSKNVEAIESAMNNVISSTGGLLCDGGNEGCAAKVITAVDAVVRSAIAAIYDCNAYSNIVAGGNAKQSIINMSKMAKDGMCNVDTEVNIILDKKKK